MNSNNSNNRGRTCQRSFIFAFLYYMVASSPAVSNTIIQLSWLQPESDMAYDGGRIWYSQEAAVWRGSGLVMVAAVAMMPSHHG